MTLDEAKDVLRTFYCSGGDDGNVRLLDITPGTHPGYFNMLVSLIAPGAHTGTLTGRELEAIRVYVGQWSEEEALALMSKHYHEVANRVE